MRTIEMANWKTTRMDLAAKPLDPWIKDPRRETIGLEEEIIKAG
jgi:hypothetical protein